VTGPLAWSMAQRIRDGQRERERLLGRAVDASNIERRRVAADLHDGVVQELAGLAYGMTAASRKAGADGAHAGRALADGARGISREMAHLRSLIVEIHPPNLQSEGIEATLSNLTAPLVSRGIDVRLNLSGNLDLPRDAQQLLSRGAQEALRNVVKHAGASAVTVSLSSDGDVACLTVEDDGRGFSQGLQAPGRPRRAAAPRGGGHRHGRASSHRLASGRRNAVHDRKLGVLDRTRAALLTANGRRTQPS